MSNRPDLDPDIATAVQQPHVRHFPMIECEFDAEDGGPVRVAGYRRNVEYDGHTWIAGTARGVITMEAIIEAPDEIPALRFTLSLDASASVAEALIVKYKNRPMRVLWCFFDDDDNLIVDDKSWQGRMSAPVIQRGPGSRTISITGEHRLADWQRDRRLLYNHADQQRIDPTDNFYLGNETFVNKDIIIFSREALIRASRR